MRPLWLVLALAGCAGITAPEPPVSEPPAPALWFVGICDRPTIWWVVRDAADGPMSELLFMSRTDSVRYAPLHESTLVSWAELDGAGFPVAGGQAGTDSLGIGRIEGQCIPSTHVASVTVFPVAPRAMTLPPVRRIAGPVVTPNETAAPLDMTKVTVTGRRLMGS
jgi:hypothetical protein